MSDYSRQYVPQQSMPQYDNRYQTYQNYSQPQSSWTQGWVAFQEPEYIKGLVLGAGLAYLLTNPTIQKALVKGAVTLWTSVQGGFEEVKEQIQDIKSEMSMKSS